MGVETKTPSPQKSMPTTDPIKRAEYNRKYRIKNASILREKRKIWEEKNKESLKEYQRKYQKEWYRKNKEKHDLRGKVWGQDPENKKKRVRYVQKYVKKNKEKVQQYGKVYSQTIAGKYRSYLSSAQKRKYDFSLTISEFGEIITGNCKYCGEKTTPMGVDRIDNTIGYTKENSTPCCKKCNYMKNKHSVTDFLSHVAKICKHNEKVL